MKATLEKIKENAQTRLSQLTSVQACSFTACNPALQPRGRAIGRVVSRPSPAGARGRGGGDPRGRRPSCQDKAHREGSTDRPD